MEARQRPSVLARTTPVPNWLLDEAMPLLSDTELRVLLVVVRSTLGWQCGTGRKESDWISHRQLRARTGRSSSVVSRAIDSLVRSEMLVVTDAVGEILLTAAQRSRSQGRLHYRLGTMQRNLRERPKAEESPVERKEVFEDGRGQGTLKSKVDFHSRAPLNLGSTSESEALAPGLTIQTLPQKVRTTKETGTKESKKEKEVKVIRLRVPTLKNEVSAVDLGRLGFTGGGAAQSEAKNTAQTQIENWGVKNSPGQQELGGRGSNVSKGNKKSEGNIAERLTNAAEPPEIATPEMRHFLQSFQRAYCVALPGEDPPPLRPHDYLLLQRRLTQYPASELEAWLPPFFECSFGYVRRRAWSLESYLNSITLLQAAQPSLQRPDPNRK